MALIPAIPTDDRILEQIKTESKADLQAWINAKWLTGRTQLGQQDYDAHGTEIVLPDTNPNALMLDGRGAVIRNYGLKNTHFAVSTNGQKWHFRDFKIAAATDGGALQRVGLDLKWLGRMIVEQFEANGCDIGIKTDLVLGGLFQNNEYQNCNRYGVLLTGQSNICTFFKDRHYAKAGQEACFKIDGPADMVHLLDCTFEGAAPVTTIHIDHNASTGMAHVCIEGTWCEHEATGQTILVEAASQLFKLTVRGWRELRAAQTTPWFKTIEGAQGSNNFTCEFEDVFIQSGAGTTPYFDITNSTTTGDPSGVYTGGGVEAMRWRQAFDGNSRYNIARPERWVNGVMPRSLIIERTPVNAGWMANSACFLQGYLAYTIPQGYPFGDFNTSASVADTDVVNDTKSHLWNLGEASGTRQDYIRTAGILDLADSGSTGSTAGSINTAASFAGATELSVSGIDDTDARSIAFTSANCAGFHWHVLFRPTNIQRGYIFRLADSATGSGEDTARYWLRFGSTGNNGIVRWGVGNDTTSDVETIDWPRALALNEWYWIHAWADVRERAFGLGIYNPTYENNRFDNRYEIERHGDFTEFGGPTSGLTLYVGGEGGGSLRLIGDVEQLGVGAVRLDHQAEHWLLGGNAGRVSKAGDDLFTGYGTYLDLTAA